MLNGVEWNRWTRLGVLSVSAVFLQSCGNPKIDFIKNGGGCAPQASAGTNGHCPHDVSACALGFADRDGQSANGCETPLNATEDYALFAVQPPGLGAFVMNEYPFNVGVTGGWCAIKSTKCHASPDSPCMDELVAFQFQVDDFLFDSVKWTDGVFTLPKPLTVIDNGMGVSVPAGSDVIGTFTVGGQRQVISLGSVTEDILISTNGTQMSVHVSGLQLSYGGYTMEDVSVRFVANRVATSSDAGADETGSNEHPIAEVAARPPTDAEDDVAASGTLCQGQPLPIGPNDPFGVCPDSNPQYTWTSVCLTCEGIRNHSECLQYCSFYSQCYRCGAHGWSFESFECPRSCGDGGAGLP